MGWNDHYPEEYIEHIATCEMCGKKFRFITEYQIPGFKMMDYLYCPYCQAELAKSMEIEFNCVEGLEDEN